MNFAYQLLKGEFNSVIPLSYIFWGIILAALIYAVSFFTKHSKREGKLLEPEESGDDDVGFCEERMKNVL